jgi:hypothetical protein
LLQRLFELAAKVGISPADADSMATRDTSNKTRAYKFRMAVLNRAPNIPLAERLKIKDL